MNISRLPSWQRALQAPPYNLLHWPAANNCSPLGPLLLQGQHCRLGESHTLEWGEPPTLHDTLGQGQHYKSGESCSLKGGRPPKAPLCCSGPCPESVIDEQRLGEWKCEIASLPLPATDRRTGQPVWQPAIANFALHSPNRCSPITVSAVEQSCLFAVWAPSLLGYTRARKGRRMAKAFLHSPLLHFSSSSSSSDAATNDLVEINCPSRLLRGALMDGPTGSLAVKYIAAGQPLCRWLLADSICNNRNCRMQGLHSCPRRADILSGN